MVSEKNNLSRKPVQLREIRPYLEQKLSARTGECYLDWPAWCFQSHLQNFCEMECHDSLPFFVAGIHLFTVRKKTLFVQNVVVQLSKDRELGVAGFSLILLWNQSFRNESACLRQVICRATAGICRPSGQPCALWCEFSFVVIRSTLADANLRFGRTACSETVIESSMDSEKQHCVTHSLLQCAQIPCHQGTLWIQNGLHQGLITTAVMCATKFKQIWHFLLDLSNKYHASVLKVWQKLCLAAVWGLLLVKPFLANKESQKWRMTGVFRCKAPLHAPVFQSKTLLWAVWPVCLPYFGLCFKNFSTQCTKRHCYMGLHVQIRQ